MFRIESLSQFTLAAMEDSGWYTANFSAVSKRKLLWGKGTIMIFIRLITVIALL